MHSVDSFSLLIIVTATVAAVVSLLSYNAQNNYVTLISAWKGECKLSICIESLLSFRKKKKNQMHDGSISILVLYDTL